MTKIGRNYDILERGLSGTSAKTSVANEKATQGRGRPNIKDDFVIPHVGPDLSDADILSFTEGLAERIMYQPDRAVNAQANQERAKVDALVH